MSKYKRIFYCFFSLLNSLALLTAFYLCINILPTFFSYFTVLSNILMTAVFIYLAVFNPKNTSDSFSWLRGAAVLYMSMTGVIYWTILVNSHSLSVDPWINLTLHGIMPLAAFLSWVIYPLKNKLEYSAAFQWLIFPLVFVAVTLIRGHYINWYPYFFLNPEVEGSLFKVLLNILGILLLSLAGGLALIWIGKRTVRG